MWLSVLNPMVDCGENVRTPHEIARVWPWLGKEPHQGIDRAVFVTVHDESIWSESFCLFRFRCEMRL